MSPNLHINTKQQKHKPRNVQISIIGFYEIENYEKGKSNLYWLEENIDSTFRGLVIDDLHKIWFEGTWVMRKVIFLTHFRLISQLFFFS